MKLSVIGVIILIVLLCIAVERSQAFAWAVITAFAVTIALCLFLPRKKNNLRR